MKNTVEMYKKDCGIISFRGKITLLEDRSKYIEVDGEIYTKTNREFVDNDVSDLLDEKSEMYEIRLDEINYVIKYEDRCSFGFGDGFAKFTSNNISTVEEVRVCYEAFKKGLLDKRIINIFTDKTQNYHGFYPIRYKRFMEEGEIDLKIFDYGFNNSLLYTISTKTFIECFESMPEEIIEQLTQKYKVKFPVYNKSEVKIGLAIMNSKTQYKNSRNNYRYR